MKLDQDPFPANMNTVELEGKKILIRPSQAESTKGKNVVIGEARKPKTFKPRSPEVGRWKANERRQSPPRPKANFDTLLAKYKDGRAGVRKREEKYAKNSRPAHSVGSSSSRASTSGKRSRTPPRSRLGEEDHQYDYFHDAPRPPFGPPMPGPWGPLWRNRPA